MRSVSRRAVSWTCLTLLAPADSADGGFGRALVVPRERVFPNRDGNCKHPNVTKKVGRLPIAHLICCPSNITHRIPPEMPPEGVRDAHFLGDEVENQLVGQAQPSLLGVQESPRHVGEEEQQAHRVEQHDLGHKLHARAEGNAGKGGVKNRIAVEKNHQSKLYKKKTQEVCPQSVAAVVKGGNVWMLTGKRCGRGEAGAEGAA